MKHKYSNRAVLALALCVACALAFGATLAQAVVNSGLGGNNDLTIRVADAESEVGDVSLKVNIYRIATGSKDADYDTYNYTFDVPAFSKLGEGYDPTTMTSDSWQSMAEAAKTIVEEDSVSPDAMAPVGEKISGLADGVYLALIPDAESERYSFTFTPALVAVPGKVGTDGAPVYNTAYGSWTNDVSAVVKWSMTQRYGSLRIDKTVTNFSGEPATFTFRVVDTETGGEKYENYAMVIYTSEGVQSDTINRIPAGMNVTVTEVDGGAQYQAVSTAGETIDIKADGEVSVSFTNVPNDSGKSGHGIENHFVFDESYNGGDWRLETRAIDASEVVSNNE